MNPDPILIACGCYNLGFVVFHLTFWRLFGWKKDLQKLSPANKAIMQILNLRLIYVFLIMAGVYFFFPNELADNRLGHFLLWAFFGFWLGRAIEQFIFLKMKHRLVTLLTVVFVVGTILHWWPVMALVR